MLFMNIMEYIYDLLASINRNMLLNKTLSNSILSCYINEIKQIESISVNCQNVQLDVEKIQLKYGTQAGKITIINNKENVKYAIKILYSKFDNNMEMKIFDIINSQNKNYITHAESYINKSICNKNFYNTIKEILMKHCKSNSQIGPCDTQHIEDILNYNGSIYFLVLKYGEFGDLQDISDNDMVLNTTLYHTNFKIDLKNGNLLLSINLQILWQTFKFAVMQHNIIRGDPNLVNMLLYVDTNYDHSNKKYYEYTIDDYKYYVSVQPFIIKHIDYGYDFVINMKQMAIKNSIIALNGIYNDNTMNKHNFKKYTDQLIPLLQNNTYSTNLGILVKNISEDKLDSTYLIKHFISQYIKLINDSDIMTEITPKIFI